MNEQEVKDLEAKADKAYKLMHSIAQVEHEIKGLQVFLDLKGEIEQRDDVNKAPEFIKLKSQIEKLGANNSFFMLPERKYWYPMIEAIMADKKEELDNKRRQLDEMFVKNIYGVEPKQTKED